MCGIVGLLNLDSIAGGVPERDLIAALEHRGPDGSGWWADSAASVALGHTRLAIIDLTEAAAQPMHSACGRWVITLNGEIYNHLELRAAVDDVRSHSGHSAAGWRTRSDVESLLEAMATFGLPEAIDRAHGMFAFAAWDRQERTLHIGRDRLGEKPLCYGIVGGCFAFASEVRVLRRLPGFNSAIDRFALGEMLARSCVPAPLCIYEGIRKLPPGCRLELNLDDVRRRSIPEPVPHWSMRESGARGTLEALTDPEAIAKFSAVMSTAVSRQMEADVELGAFLSGGIDSSTVVALMQEASRHKGLPPVRTFTIGFDSRAHDESRAAEAVAKHLGTIHTTFRMSEQDALAAALEVAAVYDEPFGDSSQIPTLMLARLARTRVKVALSGDGGDELFGGYNRGVYAERMRKWQSLIPGAMRGAAAKAISALPAKGWNLLDSLAATTVGEHFLPRLPSAKLHKALALMGCHDQSDFYDCLTRLGWPDAPPVMGWQQKKAEALAADSAHLGAGGSNRCSAETSPLSLSEQFMLADACTYLPDDILVKVDRAAMSVGLEVRSPFLDVGVAEFARALPLRFKIRHGRGKWIVRQMLARHLPDALVARPKMGFAVPLAQWLRGPLKSWADELLLDSNLRSEGLLDSDRVRAMWSAHLAGRSGLEDMLWNLLMFRSWQGQQGQ